jgi:DNA polymerase-3 subunit chi
MTRIDFYTLEPDSPGDRFLLTCRLVERIREDDLRVLIHCPDSACARHLDRLLWTFRQDSFLPHGIVGQGSPELDTELTPILIRPNGGPEREDQVLINLATDVPDFFDRFNRVCEPIDREPANLAAGRTRFKCYRDRGYPPDHHPVRLEPMDQGSW